MNSVDVKCGKGITNDVVYNLETLLKQHLSSMQVEPTDIDRAREELLLAYEAATKFFFASNRGNSDDAVKADAERRFAEVRGKLKPRR